MYSVGRRRSPRQMAVVNLWKKFVPYRGCHERPSVLQRESGSGRSPKGRGGVHEFSVPEELQKGFKMFARLPRSTMPEARVTPDECTFNASH